MTMPLRPTWWRWVGVLLVLATFTWTFHLLARGWGETDISALSPALIPSVVSFALTTASIAVAFPAFWWLLRVSGVSAPPLRELSRLHFIAQLMRHIPGRFVGVAYQITVARHLASASQWVTVNTTYMVMALWFAATLPIMLLLMLRQIAPESGLLATLVLVAGPLATLHVMGRLGEATGGRAGLLGKLTGALAAVASSMRSRGFGCAIAWYAASWIVYGLAWSAFGLSLPGVGALDGLTLCAYYSLAWALGFIIIVTPSGLGVRELAFATMAHDFPPEVVAYTAVVARLGLLCADLLLGLLSLWIGRSRHV